MICNPQNTETTIRARFTTISNLSDKKVFSHSVQFAGAEWWDYILKFDYGKCASCSNIYFLRKIYVSKSDDFLEIGLQGKNDYDDK